MSTATPLWTATPHAGFFINSVAISADGDRIVAGTFFHDYGSSTTEVHPAAKEAKLAPRVHAASASALDAGAAPSQYGRFGTYVWDRSGNPLMAAEFDGWQGVYWVASDAEGAIVASTGWRSGSPDFAGFVSAFAVETGANLLQFALPGRGNVVALDPNARMLLAGADQGYLFTRDPNGDFATPPVLIPLSGSGDTALVTALSADAAIGLVASYHGEIILFPISDGSAGTAVRWQIPGSAYLHFAALSADGRWAYAGANTGVLYALDVPALLAGSLGGPSWSAPIGGGASTIYGVACSADGTRVAVAGNVAATGGGSVSVFLNAQTEASLLWSASTAHSPNSVSFDAAGQWLGLADGHPDGTPGAFYLFDGSTGALVWSFPTSDMSWPIQLSADGSTVAAGSDNGGVYVFAASA
jgi:outer membrane protein assembly factor BamB